MNKPYGQDHDEVTVAGFEVPNSPDSSYNKLHPGIEDEARDPPLVPPHLRHTLLSHAPSQDTYEILPLPQSVNLNIFTFRIESPQDLQWPLGLLIDSDPNLLLLFYTNWFQDGGVAAPKCI